MTGVRRVAALAVVLLTLLVTGLVGAGPAAAHTELLRATPGPGRTVPGTTPRLVLEFTDAVLPRLAEVVVRRAGTDAHIGGEPQSFDGTVVVGLSGLSPGTYDVEYRVVAVDGHPVTGEYSFAVTGSPSRATTVTAVALPVATGAPVAARRTPWTVPVLGGLGVLLVLGTRLARVLRGDSS